MRLAFGSLVQLILCALSFFYFGILGRWSGAFPWILVFPLGLGVVWLILTVIIVKHAKSRAPFVFIAIAEFPFAFGWPAWMFMYTFFGHL